MLKKKTGGWVVKTKYREYSGVEMELGVELELDNLFKNKSGSCL